MKNLYFLMLTLLLTGCQNAAFMVANLPVILSTHSIKHDIAYSSQPWQKLDIHIPSGQENKKRDVVVFFYGGRWTNGSRDDYAFIGKYFADRGFITVIADYQKYPQTRFPVFVEDGAKALAWTYDHIGMYGGNNARIHVIGHSAGAHIGALLLADKHYLAAHGKTPQMIIHDFVGLAGPYAFTPDEPDLIAIFPKPYSAMQAPTFIDGTEPPMLLLWGNADRDVGLFNLEKLKTKIEAKNGYVKSAVFSDVNHIDIIKAFTWIDKDHAGIEKSVMDFLNHD
ncbi:MAG: alpha/beta hydrolase [Alphaproteobacteria bacterium]|nr:alpha/beta hydrolase [Alphaproteobacteria bacterium]